MIGKTITGPIVTVIGISLLIVLAIVMQNRARKFGKREFEKFYSASIDGIIQHKVEASTMGTFIVVNGIKYNFLPYTSELNNHSIFMNTAKPGDRVIKPAYSDTLLLIKEGQRLVYTFNKFED